MKSFFSKFSLFGKPPSDEKANAKTKAREWNRSIGKEIRRIDRDINGISRNEKSTTAEIRKLAAQGQVGSVKILAKELVFMRKTRDRMLSAKTQLNSVSNQLTQQVAVAKLTNAFQSSAEVMKSMNAIVNVPEMHAIMSEMGKEMEKMGLIESIIADGVDEALGSTLEMEEETELEINKLMEELALDNMISVPSAGRHKLGTAARLKNKTAVSNPDTQ